MVDFFGWTFHFTDEFKMYLDKEAQRIAFLTKNDDEIHMTIEVIDNKLVFHPRWNTKITFINEKEIEFTTND